MASYLPRYELTFSLSGRREGALREKQSSSALLNGRWMMYAINRTEDTFLHHSALVIFEGGATAPPTASLPRSNNRRNISIFPVWRLVGWLAVRLRPEKKNISFPLEGVYSLCRQTGIVGALSQGNGGGGQALRIRTMGSVFVYRTRNKNFLLDERTTRKGV